MTQESQKQGGSGGLMDLVYMSREITSGSTAPL